MPSVKYYEYAARIEQPSLTFSMWLCAPTDELAHTKVRSRLRRGFLHGDKHHIEIKGDPNYELKRKPWTGRVHEAETVPDDREAYTPDLSCTMTKEDFCEYVTYVGAHSTDVAMPWAEILRPGDLSICLSWDEKQECPALYWGRNSSGDIISKMVAGRDALTCFEAACGKCIRANFGLLGLSW